MKDDYNIELCSVNKYDELTEFLNSQWKRKHALVVSKDLLDWQHREGDKYNFIVAENKSTSKIDALVGFIKTSKFDPSLQDQNDYWLAIWKVKSNATVKGLGWSVLEKLLTDNKINSIAAIGINQEVKKIYEKLKWKTGYLSHYYIKNEKIKIFKIAKFKNNALNAQGHKGNEFKLMKLIDPVQVCHKYRPKKSLTYMINRYKNHPVYNYEFYGVGKRNDIFEAILVIRQNKLDKESCLRIVDVFGNLDGLPSLYRQFQELLEYRGAEYIDCLNYGVRKEVFYILGFSELDFFSNENIVPAYFEPYLQENIRIELAYKADFHYVVFKGDSDQDRPSIIN